MRKFIVPVLIGVASLALASAAMAVPHHPTGEWAVFSDCPLSNPEVEQCVFSETSGGSVKLGNQTVPIEHPTILQGGFSGHGAGIQFYGAEDGNTLSKTPQPVPGGLAGLIECKKISNFILRLACEATFENGLTGVNATLEVAGPATSIKLNTENLLFEKNATALELPVKVHLENPFLGSNCYVGSDSKPIVVDLTSGQSGSLHGKAGKISFNKNFDKTTVTGSQIVNNTFTAPGTNGCGGPIVSLILDPLISAKIGLPAGEGTNSATLEANFETGASESVIESE